MRNPTTRLETNWSQEGEGGEEEKEGGRWVEMWNAIRERKGSKIKVQLHFRSLLDSLVALVDELSSNVNSLARISEIKRIPQESAPKDCGSCLNSVSSASPMDLWWISDGSPTREPPRGKERIKNRKESQENPGESHKRLMNASWWTHTHTHTHKRNKSLDATADNAERIPQESWENHRPKRGDWGAQTRTKNRRGSQDGTKFFFVNPE